MCHVQDDETGYKCNAGHYCQAGDTLPRPCPKGTFRSGVGGEKVQFRFLMLGLFCYFLLLVGSKKSPNPQTISNCIF